jgi:hypothetical protein
MSRPRSLGPEAEPTGRGGGLSTARPDRVHAFKRIEIALRDGVTARFQTKFPNGFHRLVDERAQGSSARHTDVPGALESEWPAVVPAV